MREWCRVLHTYRHGGHQCAKFGDDTNEEHCDGSTNQDTPGTDLKTSRTLLVLGARKFFDFFSSKKQLIYCNLRSNLRNSQSGNVFGIRSGPTARAPKSGKHASQPFNSDASIHLWRRKRRRKKHSLVQLQTVNDKFRKKGKNSCTTYSMLWWRRDSWRKNGINAVIFLAKKWKEKGKEKRKKNILFLIFCFLALPSINWLIDWLMDGLHDLHGWMDLTYRRFEHTHGSLRSTLKNRKHHIDVCHGTCWIINKTNFTVHTDSSNYSKHTFMSTLRAK